MKSSFENAFFSHSGCHYWSLFGASEATCWMTRAGLPQDAAAQECVSRVQQQQRQFYDRRPQEASGEASRLYWGELSRGPLGHLGAPGSCMEIA